MKIVTLFAVLFALVMGTSIYIGARAQAGGARGGALVVATCGTLPQAYVAGSTRTWTVNTNGQVCQ